MIPLAVDANDNTTTCMIFWLCISFRLPMLQYIYIEVTVPKIINDVICRTWWTWIEVFHRTQIRAFRHSRAMLSFFQNYHHNYWYETLVILSLDLLPWPWSFELKWHLLFERLRVVPFLISKMFNVSTRNDLNSPDFEEFRQRLRRTRSICTTGLNDQGCHSHPVRRDLILFSGFGPVISRCRSWVQE